MISPVVMVFGDEYFNLVYKICIWCQCIDRDNNALQTITMLCWTDFFPLVSNSLHIV